MDGNEIFLVAAFTVILVAMALIMFVPYFV